MNRCSTAAVFLFFSASLCLGTNLSATQLPAAQTSIASASQQAAAASQAPSGDSSAVSKGTTLVAEFSHGLNAKKLKAGDKVKAVLTQDLIVKGKIMAPTESRLVGHVTEVKASTDADPESRLCVVFDKVLLKHHKELTLEAGVQALLPPAMRRSRVDEPDQMMPPMVASPGSLSTAGRGSGPSSRSTSGTTTSSVASLNSIGAVPTVQSTPGSSTPGSRVAAIDLSQINTNKINASNGMRGVYGIKGLSLIPAANQANAGQIIISKKSNVKLENGTQLILIVFR